MPSPSYRFGDFHLDPASRELRRGGREVPLHRRAFDCLVYLIEHRDRAVESDELFDAVWGDLQLSESVLRQAILATRRALDDTGEEQRLIKTVWGIGYRWVAPLEMVETTIGDGSASSPPGKAAVETTARPGIRSIWLWTPLALLAVGALIAGILRMDHSGKTGARNESPRPRATGEIALLLPVTIHGDAEHSWVRLGLMDLISTRLREAGQAMVPSDTVIAVLRGVSSPPAPGELETLAETTGAHLVLAAQAQSSGTRWIVSLRSVLGAQPPLTAVGEANDVLEAARTAADQLASSLGLTPAATPTADPDLHRLLQQIEAARLAQQMDAALALIEEAEPELRRHTEVRLQRALMLFYSLELDAAQAAFESLLEETRGNSDALFRARVLNGLAIVHLQQDDSGSGRPLLDEAAHLLRDENPAPHALGVIRVNLGIAADMLEDFDAARLHYAEARRIFESLGDVQGLAVLDGNTGVVELRRERYPEALRHLEYAAERNGALQDVGRELHASVLTVQVHLGLLDPQAAAAIEPRAKELLARTTNLDITARTYLCLAYLQDALGRSRAAEGWMSRILEAAETGDLPRGYRSAVTLLQAERMMTDEADFTRAVDLATDVVEQLAGEPRWYEERTRAWLTVVRAHLALGRHEAAAEAAGAMGTWARDRGAPSPRVYAALAEAELAAADGRDDDARAAFERAFRLADAGHVPLHVLRVAQSYVPWLLGDGPRRAPDPARALLIADRVTVFADRHYGAALLQLRVYHALGPPSAWRTALARAASLAGERQIPTALLDPPLALQRAGQ